MQIITPFALQALVPTHGGGSHTVGALADSKFDISDSWLDSADSEPKADFGGGIFRLTPIKNALTIFIVQ